MAEPKVLDFARTTIGAVMVMEQHGMRQLLIGPQVQGSAALDPDASSVSPELQGPGPISDSHYQAALLVMGVQTATQRIVVAGLGAGTGVVGLLANFPGLHITVVEIEAKVIEMCRKWFPLVGYYEAQGRLKIICADFDDVLSWSQQGDIFDVALLDAYAGTNALATKGFDAAALVATDVWVNFIGTPNSMQFQSLGQQLRLVGRDLGGYGQACDVAVIPTAIPRNILATSQDLNLQMAKQFIPFLDFEGRAADRLRYNYRQFVSTWKYLPVLTAS